MRLADRIREDLSRRIDSGADMPAKLTLAALGSHYGVSVTPIRHAVDDLIDAKDLLKLSNGRLIVNPDRYGSARGQTPPPAPAARNWEEVITRDVLLQSLRGVEGYLREEAASERYGVGRTVLRRILSRMAGAGMLVHEPRRGWRIRLFRYEEMCAYVEVRETLEIQALDLARDRLETRDLKSMLAANIPAGRGSEPRLDNRLHRYWIDRCDNYYIRDFFDRHGRYYTTLFEHAAPGAEVVDDMVQHHRAILSAVIDQDWTMARRVLSHHIRAQRPSLKKMIERIHEHHEEEGFLILEAVGAGV